MYNLGLDEFFAWYGQEPRPGFSKATVAAWRVALEARGLGAASINVWITAMRKLAVEDADNGLLAPELARVSLFHFTSETPENPALANRLGYPKRGDQ